jgi:predicted metalloenzyme YecM
MDHETSMQIKQALGDYGVFFSELLQNLDGVGISVLGFSMSHLCYRVATMAEYEAKRGQLRLLSRSFVEQAFNGRPLSMFLLRELLVMPHRCGSPAANSNGDRSLDQRVQLIELPAPKASHAYPIGLEHAGFVVGKALSQFNQKHMTTLTGQKDRGPDCKPSFITFDDGKTAKFYEVPLLETVQSQGWVFRD